MTEHIDEGWATPRSQHALDCDVAVHRKWRKLEEGCPLVGDARRENHAIDGVTIR